MNINSVLLAPFENIHFYCHNLLKTITNIHKMKLRQIMTELFWTYINKKVASVIKLIRHDHCIKFPLYLEKLSWKTFLHVE